MAFPQFTVMQRSLPFVLGLPPRTRRTKGSRFVHLLCCEGHGDREDVSPVNKAQPTHTALVSCCLFGISTEVLLHQTFLFKCCQHHTSERQIDSRPLHASSLQPSDRASSINKVVLVFRRTLQHKFCFVFVIYLATFSVKSQ